MKRKDFIRNTLLGFASLLLPEVLRPMSGEIEEEIADVEYQSLRRPYFPGKVLNIDVPFLYDFILRLAKVNGIPGAPPGEQLAFQCVGNMNILARNRTGNLNEYEPPHFGALVNKAINASAIGY